MKPEFRIKCLIFDDTPQSGVMQTKEWLETLGCEVQVLTNPSECIDNTEAILDAHIVLCDLTFNNFGAVGEPAFIPKSLTSNTKQFVRDWIKAIERWNSKIDKSLWPKPKDQFPNSEINDSDVGFWLAALMSQINPDCEIVFYTSKQEEITGPLSAIAQFRGSLFGVDTKKDITPISKTAISMALDRRQKRLLRRSPHVYQWFLRNVFLLSLIEKPPRDGTAVQLSASDPVLEFSLNAELVFPQLRELATDRKVFLRSFLIRENWQLQSWELRALYSLEHDLRPDKINGLSRAPRPEIAEYLDKLLTSAIDAGTPGQGVLALLEVARAQLQQHGVWSLAMLESAYKFCKGAVRNSEQDLDDLCREYQSHRVPRDKALEPFSMDSSFAIEPRSLAANLDTRLPFPISYLRRVVSALRHNLEGNFGLSGTPAAPQFSLQARAEVSSLAISWEDNSRGFTSITDFQDAIFNSVNKTDAQHRGLPMAILFGVEFAATSVEVLIKGTSSEATPGWHEIYPSFGMEVANEIREGSVFNFGLRWKFEYPR